MGNDLPPTTPRIQKPIWEYYVTTEFLQYSPYILQENTPKRLYEVNKVPHYALFKFSNKKMKDID